MPLGSLLGPPNAPLGGSWTPKTFKNCKVLKAFANATFWVFGALDGPLGGGGLDGSGRCFSPFSKGWLTLFRLPRTQTQ